MYYKHSTQILYIVTERNVICILYEFLCENITLNSTLQRIHTTIFAENFNAKGNWRRLPYFGEGKVRLLRTFSSDDGDAETE